jgi:seryl-tRNA synthetase
MENYQRADGGIDVPEALWSYMGGVKQIGKRGDAR